MQLKISLFLVQFILLHPDNYANAKALIGQRVRPVNSNEFPFIASIKTAIGESFSIAHDKACTGTLITPMYVITTETCLKDRLPVQIHVYLGSSDINNCTRYYTSWWLSYDLWAFYNNIIVENHGHDLSMLRLAEEVYNIEPAIIATLPKPQMYGLRVELAGWPQPTLRRPTNMKEKATVQIISDDVCNEKIMAITGSPAYIHSHIFCTFSEPYVLLSPVDDGGPVLHGNNIIGVNKKTYPLNEPEIHPGKVNIHFHLGFYLRFIDDVISRC